MGKDKELILARKNLATSREWGEIRLNLFEEIKKKSRTQIDGDFLKAMLFTISEVDEWENDFLKMKEKENKGE